MTMSEEGGYLGAMTFQCLFNGAIERVIESRRSDEKAAHELRVCFTFFDNLTFFVFLAIFLFIPNISAG